MALKQDLGQRIQYLRKQQKLTQEALAELVGIDPKNISKIENVTKEQIVKVAQNVTINTIYFLSK